MEQMIKKAHEMAKEKGFWDEERNVPEMLMLIVSEVAEALEALRKDQRANPNHLTILYLLGGDGKTPGWGEEDDYSWKKTFESSIKSSFEDELADVAIRLFDLCGGLNIDLEKHIKMKMKYNSLRPYKHGKKF